MDVIISGHSFAYEVGALLRAFFPYDTIKFVEESTEQDIIKVLANEHSIILSYQMKGTEIIYHEEPIESRDTKVFKNQMKRFIYKGFAGYLNKQLPWGTLTGIRPTKIVMDYMKQEITEDEIKNIFKKTYYTSDEKINLMIEVAKKEQKILEVANQKNGYSLYIGIPFCPSKCHYCSFSSYPLKQWEEYTTPYIEALLREIDFVGTNMRDRKLISIYIGGGTPTTLNEEQLAVVLDKIQNSFDTKDVLEFTVEAGRPDSITKNKLKVLKEYHVSRISINPQTMNDHTLEKIGRHHTSSDTIKIFHLARELGFDNINMDIIIGLSGEALTDLTYTMDQIEKLRPDSLTIHSLAVKKGAMISHNKNIYHNIEDNLAKTMLEYAEDYVTNHLKMHPYYLYRQKNIAGNLENVGYAYPDKEGIYNILIMEEMQNIIALGAGGSTKLVYPEENRIERIENVKNVTDYIQRVDEMILRKQKYFDNYLI